MKKAKDTDRGENEALERMNKALKKMLETPPETHEEMVQRRRKQSPGDHVQPGKAKGKARG